MNRSILGLLACLLLLTGFNAVAGDHQRAKQAERLFLNKHYAKALPMYAQLVSNHPENYKYNYYYGVCLLIADKDKAKAVHHLETSLKNPKSPEEVYYYLAKAYHMNYMFDESVRAISEFNKIIKPKQKVKWRTSETAEYIYNAKRTLDSSRNKNITEYILATQSDFFGKYAFEGNYGKVLSMPEEYVNKKDEESAPTVFLSPNGNVMFYSAYSNETGSRDIFRVVKKSDGSWDKPERMDHTINTKKEEMYPTCSADGNVLYFSSMGHNSTGGFDIFKSVFSRVENKWSQPENMGSPYNSPFDDFNFLPSAPDKISYFTSTRDCNQGEMMVCKQSYISGDEIPIELKGRFTCINDRNLKAALITVTKAENDSLIAIVSTDSTSGSYHVMLPGAGQYRFTIEASGYKPHNQVSYFSEFGETFYVQELYLSRDQNGTEDMAINNLKESDVAKMQDNLMALEDENGNGLTIADINAAVANMNMPASMKTENTAMPAANTGGEMTAMDDTDGIESTANKTLASMSGVEFRVQIGAFKHQTKEAVSKKLERKTNNPMMSNYSDGTWHRFYIGHEQELAKAKELRMVLVQAGFKGAFIVAFKNDQPLSSSELRALKRK